jgi:hypothetical protein
MGMFDEYLPEPPIECPNCGLGHLKFQGKDGPCNLLVWRQGFATPVGVCDESEHSDEYFATCHLPQAFMAYGGTCESCGFPAGLEMHGSAREGVWTTSTFDPELVGARDIGDGWLQCTSCSDAWERIGTRRSYYCCGCEKLAIVEESSGPA